MTDKGKLSNFLGFKIDYEKQNGVLEINQKEYINKMLLEFGMLDCNPSNTPIECKLRLDHPEDLAPKTNVPYRELVGSLMYLCNTRPPKKKFKRHHLPKA